MSDFAQIRFLPNRPLLRELSADRLNTILQEIKRNKPKGEHGITVRQDGTGTHIGLATNFRQTKEATSHPFKITSRPNPEAEGSFLVTVQPGTINGILPGNCFSGANLTETSIPGSSLQNVVLRATGDGTKLVSCQLEASGSAPDPQAPAIYTLPSELEVLLGVVYNAKVYQVVYNNLSYTGKEVLRTAKTSPNPGEVAFNIYYAWA
jgi:hypothetical protein